MLIVVICYCSRFQADFCSKYIAIFGSLFSFESCEMVLNANSLKNWCQITNDGAEVSSHVNWHCCWLVVGWCYYRKSWGNYQVSPTSLRSKDSSNRRQWSWTRCTDKISWAFRHSWTDKQSWAADQRSSGRGIVTTTAFVLLFFFEYIMLILQSSAGWCWVFWYWIWWPEI